MGKDIRDALLDYLLCAIVLAVIGLILWEALG